MQSNVIRMEDGMTCDKYMSMVRSFFKKAIGNSVELDLSKILGLENFESHNLCENVKYKRIPSTTNNLFVGEIKKGTRTKPYRIGNKEIINVEVGKIHDKISGMTVGSGERIVFFRNTPRDIMALENTTFYSEIYK